LVERALLGAFGEDVWVRGQMPLCLREDCEAEPGVAVVRGSPRDYREYPHQPQSRVRVSDLLP
jgi:hypothetical protein